MNVQTGAKAPKCELFENLITKWLTHLLKVNVDVFENVQDESFRVHQSQVEVDGSDQGLEDVFAQFRVGVPVVPSSLFVDVDHLFQAKSA